MSVTISNEEYEALIRDSILLNCLHNAGVDNWEGYSVALEEFVLVYLSGDKENV